MRTVLFLSAITLGVAFNSAVRAQDLSEMPAPAPEHEFLQKFVGEWTTSQKGEMAPGQAIETKGTISSRSLGGFWVINTMKAEMPGMAFEGVQTLGYDPEKGKYVGTWVDSMTSMIWHYEGTLDEETNRLVLEADGPNFMTGEGTTKFQDIYQFTSDTEVIIESKMMGPDGEWVTFMSGTGTKTGE